MQKYSYIFIMLLLFACAPKQPKAPDDVLSRQQMSSILTDMHLADAVITMKPLSNDSNYQEGVNYREAIYKKFRVTHEQFNKSFAFYKENPILMDSIYADVITRLSAKEMRYRGK